jgi:hypothetical protein
MKELFTYVDPSASSLLIQFLLSLILGSFLFLRRSFSQARGFLTNENLEPGIWCAIAAVSFANLAMFRVWTELFGYRPGDAFEMKHPPLPSHYLSALFATLLLAVIIGPIIAWGAKSGRIGKMFSAIFLLLWFIPLNALRDVVGSRYLPLLRFTGVRLFGPAVVAFVGITLAALLLTFVFWHQRFFFRFLCLLLIAGSPFVLLTAGSSLVRASTYSPAGFEDQVSASRPSERKSAPRVVWVIFDELDQRLAFDERPAGLQMPEFDRFRREAFYSDRVTEAGNDTIFAIPSLMIGRKIVRVREAGVGELKVAFAGSSIFSSFKETPNLFGQLRHAGLNAGLVAWGTPYCRMFGSQVSRCWWCESPRPDNSISDNVGSGTIDSLRSLFETPNFSMFGQSLCTRHQSEIYQSVNREAFSVASDPQIDVAFLQLTGAHPPHFYNRYKDNFTLGNSPIRGYTDSLALCDKTLASLKLAMQSTNVWSKSVVILSSDHHNRSSPIFDGKIDHRVVFMVKFPGEGRGLYYHRDINALVSGPMVFEIATGHIRDEADLVDWINHRERDGGWWTDSKAGLELTSPSK